MSFQKFSCEKCQTCAASLHVRIFTFSLSFMIVNDEALRLGLLVEKKKQSAVFT